MDPFRKWNIEFWYNLKIEIKLYDTSENTLFISKLKQTLRFYEEDE